MDISIGLGLAFGGAVLVTLIMMGGDLRMFVDLHAFIVIFGGATAATLIRFPLSTNFHGLPMGLSADRANAIRGILEEEGVPTANFSVMAGRAETEPLLPDDPFVVANNRVTITLLHEAPPIPANLRP